jgi:hypothetical protein
MRNRFACVCYRCGKTVMPGAGHFERQGNGWRTQHADCCIKARAEKYEAQKQDFERKEAGR